MTQHIINRKGIQMKKILILAAVLTGLMSADAYDIYFTKLIKTTEGFSVKKIKTYYAGRIIWGEGYCDHNNTTAFRHGVVMAYGTNWSHSAVTDENGDFKVEVKANSEFTIKASDGSQWHTYEGTLPAIPIGTTGQDK